MSKKIIVVGLSAASVAFVTKLRSFDKESEIICFSAEPDMPYNRCLLADFLTGELDQQELQLKDPDFYQNNNIQVFFNTYVTRLDTQNQKVYVQDIAYEYEYLFLGVGTRPLVPKSLTVDGVQGVFTFHTLQDMVAINQYIDNYQPKKAVVIGVGLNGIEAVSSLHQKGLEVTVVEAQATILPGQVQADVASWLLQRITAAGVTVYTSTKVISIQSQQGKVSGTVLDSQSVVLADMVIVAAGSLVNSELLEHTGIDTVQGSIVVSNTMQTSINNVFAAGDVCMVPDFITKKMVRSTTWSDAMLQGLCAATSLGSTPRPYQGAIGIRDSYFFGMPFYGCGQTVNQSLKAVVRHQTDTTLDIVYLDQNGCLQGFVLLGDISPLSDLKKMYMIQETIDL